MLSLRQRCVLSATLMQWTEACYVVDRPSTAGSCAQNMSTEGSVLFNSKRRVRLCSAVARSWSMALDKRRSPLGPSP